MNLNDLIPSGHIQFGTKAFYFSGTFTAPKAGYVLVTGMGGGAGGSRSKRPGNSAPWGVKLIRVAANDVITINVAAATAGNVAIALAGNATTVLLNGVTVMICSGGEGNTNDSTLTPVTATCPGADFYMPGRQPQGDFGFRAGGGAAVDLGWGTYSASPLYGDFSVAQPQITTVSLGAPFGSYCAAFDLVLLPVFEPGVGRCPYPGMGSNPSLPSPMFGGGNGHNDTSVIQPAGRGGSGGWAGNSAHFPGAGGAGYGYLRFFAKVQ